MAFIPKLFLKPIFGVSIITNISLALKSSIYQNIVHINIINLTNQIDSIFDNNVKKINIITIHFNINKLKILHLLNKLIFLPLAKLIRLILSVYQILNIQDFDKIA